MTRAVHLYGHLLHDMHVSSNIVIMIAKAMFSLSDQVTVSDDPRTATRTLGFMFQVFVEKLETLTTLRKPIAERIEKAKNNDKEVSGIFLIESSRPESKPFWVTQKPEDFVNGKYHVLLGVAYH